MKKLVSLVGGLLALTMLLTLCACGGEAEETPDPAAENEPTQTETVDTVDVDLTALSAQLVADCGITDYVDLASDKLISTYQLPADQVVAAAGFNATSSGAFPQEIVLVQAADETAAAAVADQLTARLSSIAEQAASYDPASLELAENCSVVTQGVYVGLFFSEHHDAMVSAFQSAVG